jgi:hypothetical protein
VLVLLRLKPRSLRSWQSDQFTLSEFRMRAIGSFLHEFTIPLSPLYGFFTPSLLASEHRA